MVPRAGCLYSRGAPLAPGGGVMARRCPLVPRGHVEASRGAVIPSPRCWRMAGG